LVVSGARLYYRDLGEGKPIIVLHGGPDFDHNYLVPEMDRLAGSFRVIYYDQRGRGRSVEGVAPEDVSVSSEVEDLEEVRRSFGLDPVALLGHSWGGVLAMEYAIRHPEHVSHLILLNTAAASHRDFLATHERLLDLRPAGDVESMQKLSTGAAFAKGSLDAEADYYRIHFKVAIRQPEHLERIIERLRSNFTEETVVLARAIEQRPYDETWRRADYDLLPLLGRLDIPTLVIHGEDDFIPVEVPARIAQTISGAQFSVLPGCGHFAYLECAAHVRDQIAALLKTR
jgi:proline iminopeptidase